jgi:hypothetical protein
MIFLSTIRGDLDQTEAILGISENNSVGFWRNSVGTGVRTPPDRFLIPGFSVGGTCPPVSMRDAPIPGRSHVPQEIVAPPILSALPFPDTFWNRDRVSIFFQIRKIPGEKNSERENLWPKKILCPKIPAEKIFRLKKSGLKNF